MSLSEITNNADGRNVCKFIWRDITLLISFLSIVSDIGIGLALIIQYYSFGYKSWAIITFSFVFIPSIIMQILSIKLYLSNRNMLLSEWLLHSLLLGIIHRYISAFRKCERSYRSKNCIDSNIVKTDLIILKNLYLFKSFLESAPQLVLHLYFIVISPVSLPLTAIVAATSAFSIAWGLVIHTKIKDYNDFPRLVFLVLWRVGMITARISALVLCAYTCGPWIILFIGSHWLAMTLWITYQKSALDEKDKKGEFHSALFGVIYCFCFITLKTDQSRSNAFILNSLLLFQNLIFLTVFLLSFSDKSPKLAVASFVTITFGSLVGITSFLIYNTFFHPRGPFKCITSLKGSICCKRKKGLFRKETTFRSLTKNGNKMENTDFKPQKEQIEDTQSPSDSVIIIEESPTSISKVDEKILGSHSEEIEHIYDEPKTNEMKKESEEEVKLSAALKRRAMCSSVDFTRFLDRKIENTDWDSNKTSSVDAAEETPSEILSTHDYENLCAVNIAREPWGIRSWRVYSDIETYRHDDSVFNERQLDNMTTSSEYSGKIEDRDSVNTAEDELLHCDIDTTSDKTSINFVPPPTASMLHTIFEEHESPSGCVPRDDFGGKCNSESALVATIDKICLYTPLRGRSGTIDNCTVTPVVRLIPANEGTLVAESKIRKELHLKNDQKDVTFPLKEKIRCVQKFSIFKERYETNRCQVCEKNGAGGSGTKLGDTNKENVPAERASNDKTGRSETKKSYSIKEKSSLLMQKLTPSKLEKRTFPISPIRR